MSIGASRSIWPLTKRERNYHGVFSLDPLLFLLFHSFLGPIFAPVIMRTAVDPSLVLRRD